MTSSWQRQPAFADRFYPGDPGRLTADVDRLLTRTDPGTPQEAIAVMVPHAGYVFSGATAGRVFGAVTVPRRVVILSPNHTGLGARCAIWPRGTWATPLGTVPIDASLCTVLMDHCPWLAADRTAHEGEHGIEVELPFLQRRQPELQLTPLVLGALDREESLALGAALAETIAEAVKASGEPILLVASTDMSHFLSAEVARQLDMRALAQLEARAPGALHDVVRMNGITMCGVVPTTAVLEASNQLGCDSAEVIEYTHSGEITGDASRVVAYAGALMTRTCKEI